MLKENAFLASAVIFLFGCTEAQQKQAHEILQDVGEVAMTPVTGGKGVEARAAEEVKADYPPVAFSNGVEGTVWIEVDTFASGLPSTPLPPKNVRVLLSSGHPALDKSAVMAAQNAKYYTAKAVSGLPIESTIQISFNFKIPK